MQGQASPSGGGGAPVLRNPTSGQTPKTTFISGVGLGIIRDKFLGDGWDQRRVGMGLPSCSGARRRCNVATLRCTTRLGKARVHISRSFGPVLCVRPCPQVAADKGRYVAVLMDLQGPEVGFRFFRF